MPINERFRQARIKMSLDQLETRLEMCLDDIKTIKENIEEEINRLEGKADTEKMFYDLSCLLARLPEAFSPEERKTLERIGSEIRKVKEHVTQEK